MVRGRYIHGQQPVSLPKIWRQRDPCCSAQGRMFPVLRAVKIFLKESRPTQSLAINIWNMILRVNMMRWSFRAEIKLYHWLVSTRMQWTARTPPYLQLSTGKLCSRQETPFKRLWMRSATLARKKQQQLHASQLTKSKLGRESYCFPILRLFQPHHKQRRLRQRHMGKHQRLIPPKINLSTPAEGNNHLPPNLP